MINFKRPSGPLLFFLCVFSASAIFYFIFFESIKFGMYGINKTVGRAFDICSLALLSSFLSLIVFVLGYSVLSLFKTRVNRVVSMIHIACIAFLVILHICKSYCILKVLLSIGAVVIFFINTGFAICYKLVDNKLNN